MVLFFSSRCVVAVVVFVIAWFVVVSVKIEKLAIQRFFSLLPIARHCLYCISLLGLAPVAVVIFGRCRAASHFSCRVQRRRAPLFDV